MRVTATMLANSLIANLDAGQARLQQLQEEAATGQRFQYPADNPEAVTATMNLNQALADIRRYLSNITAAQNFLNTTAGALQQMTTNLNRALALGIQAQSGTNSPQDLSAIGEQLQQLSTEIATILNTQYQGVYIFAAANPQTTVATGSPPADQNLAASAATAVKDTLPIGHQASVTENINGYELGGTSVLAAALNAVESLQQAVVSGNPSSITTAVSSLQAIIPEVTEESTIVGARLERLTAQASRLGTLKTDLEQSVATVSGANMARVTTNLALEEQALKAALESGAQVLPLSLLNFIQP
ncbi:Flagellar hook-associated protein flgL [Candidatus Hydrogenisulfobacillus filiaventi]|uniref:Flagellar hook-associated protein flgL n=1 Tax=Candidatus Hydrogenisulfobacillus filiaventi TaxID=2707344 RepID=A0A6F8ZEE8_9FIRM|nr:flagellar biosynthesis protein FlgL [Bacillota bacterium]CAB1128040.1 Flagellar hook-associated protein flgL [Candidatus Hydrogenisulfobacillus filiaventi]